MDAFPINQDDFDAKFRQRTSVKARRKYIATNASVGSEQKHATVAIQNLLQASIRLFGNFKLENIKNIGRRTFGSTNKLCSDICCAICIAMFRLAQVLSYAMLVGIHPYCGLLSSILPMVLMILFGSNSNFVADFSLECCFVLCTILKQVLIIDDGKTIGDIYYSLTVTVTITVICAVIQEAIMYSLIRVTGSLFAYLPCSVSAESTEMIRENETQQSPVCEAATLKTIVLDCSAVADIDYTGAKELKRVFKVLPCDKKQEIKTHLRKRLADTELFKTLPKEAVFPSVRDAVLAAEQTSGNENIHMSVSMNGYRELITLSGASSRLELNDGKGNTGIQKSYIDETRSMHSEASSNLQTSTNNLL
uniref:STAS domain-containing protein n=1 Tax=Syphacia muris TaxID=451379 RepID=A0A158R603_9BILA